MIEIIELELSNGKSVFVEVEKSETFNEMSGGSQKVVKQSFEIVSATLGGIAEDIETKLSSLKEKRPDKVVVEINANIKAGGTLFFASGEANGGVKLQMTWDK